MKVLVAGVLFCYSIVFIYFQASKHQKWVDPVLNCPECFVLRETHTHTHKYTIILDQPADVEDLQV